MAIGISGFDEWDLDAMRAAGYDDPTEWINSFNKEEKNVDTNNNNEDAKRATRKQVRRRRKTSR